MRLVYIDFSKQECSVPAFESMEPVSSYPFNPQDMQSYLEGTKPVPNYGGAVPEYNGIPSTEVTGYARDTFEAIEALKTCARIGEKAKNDAVAKRSEATKE